MKRNKGNKDKEEPLLGILLGIVIGVVIIFGLIHLGG